MIRSVCLYINIILKVQLRDKWSLNLIHNRENGFVQRRCNYDSKRNFKVCNIYSEVGQVVIILSNNFTQTNVLLLSADNVVIFVHDVYVMFVVGSTRIIGEFTVFNLFVVLVP
jgi:hypothetical protein